MASVAGHFSAASACATQSSIEVRRNVRIGLEEGSFGDRPVREEILVVPDARVFEPRGVLSQRVGQTDLIDDANVETDVHADHAEVGEEHGDRPDFAPGRVSHPGCAGSIGGGDGGHDVPLVIVARRQQQRAVRCVVDRRLVSPACGDNRDSRRRSTVRVAGGLRVEPAFVDDPE